VSNLVFSLTVVGPVFLIIGTGVLLRVFHLLDQVLADGLTKLVFHLFLPALVIKTLIHTDFSSIFSFRLILISLGILIVSFFAAWLVALVFGVRREARGLFASGSTWSNVAIVGYALGEALYGEEGLARAAVFSALVLPMHIIIGSIAMDRDLFRSESGKGGYVLLRRLAVNPVILAVLAGAGLSFIPVEIPRIADDVLGILGKASLPLALVAIGGSLEFRMKSREWLESLGAASVKLLLMPSIAFLAASAADLSPEWTGSIVLGFSCPSAVSFFVISRSLGQDPAKSAAIVTATTLGAAFTAGLVVFVLKTAGLA
jgi:hypothetical protein